MEFNAKFFLTTLVLSLAAGILSHLINWLLILRLLFPWRPYDLYTFVAIGTLIGQFLIGVFLTFAVLYFLSTRESSAQKIKQSIVSTFLGCWIGGYTIVGVDILISAFGERLGTDFLQNIPYFLWQIFAAAFSLILFVSLTAILYAYYQKTTTPCTPPTPPQ